MTMKITMMEQDQDRDDETNLAWFSPHAWTYTRAEKQDKSPIF